MPPAELAIAPTFVKAKNHGPIKRKAKGGVLIPFPVKLHGMLDNIEADGLSNVVSWSPHGRCFCVHKPKEFVNQIMPRYFKQTKMASFHRQLNLYGFKRLTGGLDRGGYYHKSFLRDNVNLAYSIHRMRIKGTFVRLPTNPNNEPNFHDLLFMPKNHTLDLSASVVTPELRPLVSEPTTDFVLTAQTSVAVDDHVVPSCESHNYSAHAKQQQQRQAMIDVLFFEGRPFHYIDSSEFKTLNVHQPQPQPAPSTTLTSVVPPNLVHSPSTVVSKSISECDDAFLSSLSRSFDEDSNRETAMSHLEDIDTFFQSIGMPMAMYQEKIDEMSSDDDAAFGHLSLGHQK